MEGIVVSHQANFFAVRVGDAEYACNMRGRLKKEGETPLVGDRVEIVLEPVVEGEPERDDRRGAIVAIAPRTHELERPAIANVDQLLVVMAADSPPFSPFLLDKFLVVATKSGLTPVIVVNKRDLVPAERLAAIVGAYARLGYQVFATEASPGGVAELLPALAHKVTVLAGPSGVGKSSIVNAIQPGLHLAAGEVSTKLQRGRHTTRHAQLYAVAAAPGALLADTPGFSYLTLAGVLPAELGWFFPEMTPLIPECRMPSCLHDHEPDCAVKAAPVVAPERYESYLRLLAECQAYEREAADRSSKEEGAVKRRSGRHGQEARLVKVDAADREADRRTRKQQLDASWQAEAEDGGDELDDGFDPYDDEPEAEDDYPGP